MAKPAKWKQTIYSLAERSGAARVLQSIGAESGSQVYVLAYHRVDTPDHRPWLNPELISAAPEPFDRQMALLRRDYHPVTVEQVLDAAHGGKRLPRYAVLVTVDDGYRDFAEVILPVCRRYDIRPLLFVTTGAVGRGGFWWDRLYQAVYLSGWNELPADSGERVRIATPEEQEVALKRLSQSIKHSDMEHGVGWLDELDLPNIPEAAESVLNWDELREAVQYGADLAMHTHTHPILSRVSAEKISAEIRQSRAVLLSQTGCDLPVFAYPDGVAAAISQQARDVVKEEGIQLAFTMIAGRADLARDAHDYLPRLGTWGKLNLGHFHLRLTPAFTSMASNRKREGNE